MPIYTVTLTESYTAFQCVTVEIEAPTSDDALSQARNGYNEGAYWDWEWVDSYDYSLASIDIENIEV